MIIYIDETNFNLFCRKNFGRRRRGERAVVRLPNSKGPNLHITGAVSNRGLAYWERRRGAYKKEDCREWLRRCLRQMAADGFLMENLVLVLDNAPAHSQIENVLQEPEFLNVIIQRLSPYSPMLNAIESVWSRVKLEIKNEMQQRLQELLAGDPAGILTQVEFRLRFLESIADRAMRNVTLQHCIRACNPVQEFYATALQLNDMPVGQ